MQEYQNVLEPNDYTNTASDSCYDGIIMHKKMKNKRYRKHGVSEIQTKEGMKESGVSDHRPVWVELKYVPKETVEIDSENETEETDSEVKNNSEVKEERED